MKRLILSITVLFMATSIEAIAFGAIEGFDESFDGGGSYTTERGVSVSGLDNPGWGLYIDESLGSLNGNGYVFDVVAPAHEAGIPSEFNQWGRELSGFGSFRETIRISDLEAGWYSSGSSLGTPRNTIQVIHSFGGEFVYQVFNIYFDTLVEPELNNKLLWNAYAPPVDVQRVPDETMDIEFGIEYDRLTQRMTYFLDSPGTGRIFSGPHEQTLPEDMASIVWMNIASERDGRISGRLDNWSLEPLPDVRADINDDGVLTAADVDLLSLIIRRHGTDAVADLSIDGKVDQTDLGLWIHDHRKTYFGDANLDGLFSSQDLTLVFQAGGYEDLVEANSDWAEGDWNADAEFTSSDLVVAFQDGGYEEGPRPAVSAVPEPTGHVLLVVGLCGLLRLRAAR